MEESESINILKYDIIDFLENEMEELREEILNYDTDNDRNKLLIFSNKKINAMCKKIQNFKKEI